MDQTASIMPVEVSSAQGSAAVVLDHTIVASSAGLLGSSSSPALAPPAAAPAAVAPRSGPVLLPRRHSLRRQGSSTSASTHTQAVHIHGGEFIYVLELQNGMYYVGRSAQPFSRITQHHSGIGAEWTRAHRPLRVIECNPCASAMDEDNAVRKYMLRYGIDRVRGGSYAQMQLTATQRQMLTTEMCTATNACFRCHRIGHFMNTCTHITRVDGTLFAPMSSSSSDSLAAPTSPHVDMGAVSPLSPPRSPPSRFTLSPPPAATAAAVTAAESPPQLLPKQSLIGGNNRPDTEAQSRESAVHLSTTSSQVVYGPRAIRRIISGTESLQGAALTTSSCEFYERRVKRRIIRGCDSLQSPSPHTSPAALATLSSANADGFRSSPAAQNYPGVQRQINPTGADEFSVATNSPSLRAPLLPISIHFSVPSGTNLSAEFASAANVSIQIGASPEAAESTYLRNGHLAGSPSLNHIIPSCSTVTGAINISVTLGGGSKEDHIPQNVSTASPGFPLAPEPTSSPPGPPDVPSEMPLAILTRTDESDFCTQRDIAPTTSPHLATTTATALRSSVRQGRRVYSSSEVYSSNLER
jgi:predicted GIY-YIG superfamily endonuclease